MLGKRKRGGSAAGNAFRKVKPVDEVTFNFDARQDYLTGFRKRKQQRIKHAQEEATKREREGRIQERKELRESRRKELEEHVKAVDVALKRAEGLELSGASDEEPSDSDSWSGISDKRKDNAVSHQDEYSDSDEDQEATVTIEAVEIDRDGLHAAGNASEEQDDTADLPAPSAAADHSKSQTRTKGPTKQQEHVKPKKRRKKFRYESKEDRKVNRAKEKAVKARKRAKRRE